MVREQRMTEEGTWDWREPISLRARATPDGAAKAKEVRASGSTRCATRCGATTCSWSPGRLCVATAARPGWSEIADVESLGVDRWLGALARDLKDGTYRPRPVQVLIPTREVSAAYRASGTGCADGGDAGVVAYLRSRPAPEQYAYRPGRHAHGAVKRVHRLRATRRWLTPTCQTTSAKSARRPAAVHRPARERRAAVGVGQGMAGDGGRRGRRSRRTPPHEPGAS